MTAGMLPTFEWVEDLDLPPKFKIITQGGNRLRNVRDRLHVRRNIITQHCTGRLEWSKSCKASTMLETCHIPRQITISSREQIKNTCVSTTVGRFGSGSVLSWMGISTPFFNVMFCYPLLVLVACFNRISPLLFKDILQRLPLPSRSLNIYGTIFISLYVRGVHQQRPYRRSFILCRKNETFYKALL